MPNTRSQADVIDRLLSADSMDEVSACCRWISEFLGFEHFLFATQDASLLSEPKFTLINGYPDAWQARYQDLHYIEYDPIAAHCYQHTTPIVWTDIDIAALPKVSRQVMQEANETGLRFGLSIPLHSAGGHRSALNFAASAQRFKDRDTAIAVTSQALLLATYVDEAVRRITLDDAPDFSNGLTGREKECLAWAADGKTSWETSVILGVAERTVVFHIQNAVRKLGVSNRCQAIARAVASDKIQPRFPDADTWDHAMARVG